jgi:hypothetical protein
VDRTAPHVAQLHSVADLVLSIDGPHEIPSLLVEREIRDVADEDLLARRELAEQEICG